MKVENMTSSKGNTVPNQFILRDREGKVVFQSYDTIIAEIDKNGTITLDNGALGYSNTTSKYLYQFLRMDRKEIKEDIKNKVISLTDLNANGFHN